MRQLKLQSRLKEQRKGQTASLRGQIENTSWLVEVLAGNQAGMSKETAGREVLLAFHQWLLDYPGDGHRQGFPFDPYLLYFHRRIVRASVALEQLLSSPQFDGKLENPAHKLAQAGQTAGSWTKWRKVQNPLNHGRLPQRLIRQADFLDQLTATYHDHCNQDAA